MNEYIFFILNPDTNFRPRESFSLLCILGKIPDDDSGTTMLYPIAEELEGEWQRFSAGLLELKIQPDDLERNATPIESKDVIEILKNFEPGELNYYAGIRLGKEVRLYSRTNRGKSLKWNV